jgi:hypothetical protein
MCDDPQRANVWNAWPPRAALSIWVMNAGERRPRGARVPDGGAWGTHESMLAVSFGLYMSLSVKRWKAETLH